MKVFAAEGPKSGLTALEIESPVPHGREVLLKVTHSGVCHTDVHSAEGSYDMGGQGELSLVDRGLEYPAVFGHEIVGEVIAVGPDAEGVNVGDRRLVFPWLGCGECRRCRSEQTNLCASGKVIGVFRWGGFADEVLVPDSECLVDIEGLDPSWAATLACSGLTAYSALKRALPLDVGETLAVVGVGGVGLAAVAIAATLTEAEIVAVDVSDANLKAAADLGANRTVNSAELGEETLAAHLGRPLQAAVDFVNTGGTFRLAFDSLEKAGTLVSVGLFGGEVTVPTVTLPLKSLSIHGNYVGNLPDLRELVRLAQAGSVPRVPITEKPLNLEEVVSGLDDLSAGRARGRTVLVNQD